MSSAMSERQNVQLTGPYDSLRDYIVALEARGRLLRIKEMDQDQYEATGFAYRLIEKCGHYEAPAFLIERIKINGRWMDGPIISNLYGGWDTEAMAFGVETITEDQHDMYRATLKKVKSLADDQGQWKKIKPELIERHSAPCKDVVITGDDVDLFQFPWLKSNPKDAGQYINTASVILEDPELGRNVAINRCQVKSKNKLGLNIKGQDGFTILMTKLKRGERTAKVAVVQGVDPIVYTMSCSKLAGPGDDELEIAGGLRGKPVEVVKCETSDILVPAHAELVIEGEIPIDQKEEEGPFAEVYGYLGQLIPQNFIINVKAITHRHNPWFINAFSGATKLRPKAPTEADNYFKYKKIIPNFVDCYSPDEAMGITILSIDKRFPGEGLAAGQIGATSDFFSKVIIVVDKDVDVSRLTQVLHAVGSRWQPHPATMFIKKARGIVLDPSTPVRRLTSKIIIDATKQLPEEGGPDSWPAVSRQLLEEHCPDVFNLVDDKWSDYWKDFD